MELLILLGLIVLNGVFAMSELAIVSAKKSVLRQKIEEGNKAAQTALTLAEDPERFLSTVQIGITLIGIIAGAFGGSAIASDIADIVRTYIPALAAQANEIGFGLIVALTTYLSLVIGELVPKQVALNHAEQVAINVAPMMHFLSQAVTPLVWFLSQSTGLLSRILGIKETNDYISDFEIIAMMREGLHTGVFDAEEHDMVKGALMLDDRRIREIMTPRIDLIWLNTEDSEAQIRQKVGQQVVTNYPLCKGNLDNVIGIVRAKDILDQVLHDTPIDLMAIVREELFVPETAIVADVLKIFRERATHVALVIDEHGGFEGIITLSDIMEAILGDIEQNNTKPVQRSNGSWLFDGDFAMGELPEYLPDFEIPDDESSDYTTLAGFILKKLGRIPEAADQFSWQQYQVEVVDMDNRRIDKVLITPVPENTISDETDSIS